MRPTAMPQIMQYSCSGEERTKNSSSLSYLNCLYQIMVTTTPLVAAAAAVLRILSISKKVESISSISALGNSSATASWGGCIKVVLCAHHTLAAREARRTWHFQPLYNGRPLIKPHKVGEFPNHWKFQMAKKRANVHNTIFACQISF